VRALEVASSSLASALRLGAGRRARSRARQPAQRLELYEFEACPFCRLVREALSELDLEATIHPCPRGGTRFRPKAAAIAGREMFPLLVDPNTGRHLLESSDIVRYLRDTYDGDEAASAGAGDTKRRASASAWRPLTVASSGMAGAVRHGRGSRARSGRSSDGGSASPTPERPLELWSFEACPYCRLVREVLCELELPYVLHNVAQGSSRREAFVALSGRMMVPYLVDPNTGASLFESADIVRYLESTYGA
jgi:glutathione S-transferase